MDTTGRDPVTFRVLGPVDARRGGEGVQIASPMQRRLMAALAVGDGRTVSTHTLVTALWGEDPPASARNSLQSHVARLREALGPGHGIVTRPPGYQLDLEVAVVDARVFEERVAEARRRLRDDPDFVVEEVTAALASWRGDAYGEFAEEFAREEAVRLEEVRAGALEVLAQAQLATGVTGAAVDTARRLVAMHPYRESAAVLAARTLSAHGRVPEALDVLRHHRTRLADELGLDPSGQVGRLEAALLQASPSPTAEAPAQSSPDPLPTAGVVQALPGPPTSVVGRMVDRGRVAQALDAGPLVTIVGPGGVGKTTLAGIVAAEAPRAAWVDLTAVRADGDVVSVIADALALRPGPHAREAVVQALRSFSGTVVLDNCEHVLDTVADLVATSLRRPGPTRIIATSREPLRVAGETVVPLGPLPVPDPATATSSDPAVRLFCDRLVAAGGQDVTPETAARVAAAVDGLPLGLELAAARAASLPVEVLLARLPEDLDLLAGNARRQGRHSTLRRVIAWSHDLLTPDEQALFRRLAVFTATFRLDDVEEVCADERLPASSVAVCLGRLVDASMVARVGAEQFRLLEPLRLFAAGQLDAQGEVDAVQDRQRDAVVALAARAATAMAGADEADVVAEVERMLPDIRAVHARAVAVAELETVARIVGGLHRFAYAQARADLLAWGAALVDDEVADGTAPELRGAALAAAAAGCWMMGELERARDLAAWAATFPADALARATVAEIRGDIAAVSGDFEDAEARYGELLGLGDDLDHPGLRASGHVGIALIRSYQGDAAGAESHARSAVAAADRARALSIRALAHYTLGEVLTAPDPERALVEFAIATELAVAGHARLAEGVSRTAEVALRGRHGDPGEALRRYREALAVWREAGADGLLLNTLRNLFVLLVRVGADADAVALDASLRRLGTKPTFAGEARDLETARAAVRERLPQDARIRAEATGEGIEDLRAAADKAIEVLDRLRAQPRS